MRYMIVIEEGETSFGACMRSVCRVAVGENEELKQLIQEAKWVHLGKI